MDFSHWTKRLKLYAKQIRMLNGIVHSFYIGEKATEEEIQKIEEEMGLRVYLKNLETF